MNNERSIPKLQKLDRSLVALEEEIFLRFIHLDNFIKVQTREISEFSDFRRFNKVREIRNFLSEISSLFSQIGHGFSQLRQFHVQ